MPDPEASDADLVEQELPPSDQPLSEEVDVSVEVPEADAVEQAQGASSTSTRPLEELPDEAAEGDALEQAQVVELDEEEGYRE